MKKFVLVIFIVLLQTGCAMAPKVHAIRSAADDSKFQGMDSNTRLAVSIPSAHSGPYGSVSQFNFRIQEGKHKDQNASAIVGKSRSTGEWEVLMMMINKNGKWISLPKSD